MKFSEICSTLEAELYDACLRYIPLLTAELKDQRIYAFTILLSGFDAMGLCANTEEDLERRIVAEQTSEPVEFRVPKIYIEMNAAEWVHMGGYWQVFSKVNETLDVFRKRLYAETGFVDLGENQTYDQIVDIADDKFKQIIVTVLKQLKQEGLFSTAAFSKDLFLGVQYNDIGYPEIAIIEAVSNQLNSKYWAGKLAEIKIYIQEQTPK